MDPIGTPDAERVPQHAGVSQDVLHAVAVVNENDTVATEEIRYGDNDRLAARTAQLAGCSIAQVKRVTALHRARTGSGKAHAEPRSAETGGGDLSVRFESG